MTAVLLSCALFAVWPMEATHVATPVIQKSEPAPKQVASLDLSAFRVPLWVAEPAPPAPPTAASPPAPPPPPRLQLLAITHEGATYRAAVYDPDSDRILIVGAGEMIGTRSVDKVDKSTVTLRDDAGNRVLALRTGEGS